MKRKRIPSKLKKLAEKRSRISASIIRYDRIKSDVQIEINKLEEKVQILKEKQYKLEHQVLLNHNEIRAIDKVIKSDFPSITPEEIPATFCFRKEYGKRGGLNNAILALITNSGAEGISARDIADAVCEKFDIKFTIPEERRAWMKNSLYPAIKKLALAERIRNNGLPASHSRWMSNTKALNFDDLTALPHQTG